MNDFYNKKILVTQTAFLGDVILSTPVVREINKIFRYSQIDVLTRPDTQIVFKYNPYVNKTLVFDKKGKRKKLASFIELVKLFREIEYDLAISIQSSFTSAMLMVLGKIPNRVGFDMQKFLTIPIPYDNNLHTREKALSLLKPFFNEEFDSQTQLFWSQREDEKAQRIFDIISSQSNYVVGIAPGSVWQTKRWLKEYYISLARMLTHENFSLVFIGGKTERELCHEIIAKSRAHAFNLAGDLNVLESAALIDRLDLMITNDSAPLHIANAVKTDVLAIFGPTVKEFGFYPFRENDRMLEIPLYCRPCGKHGGRYCPERHYKCMRLVTPEMVFDAVNSMIESKVFEYEDKVDEFSYAT